MGLDFEDFGLVDQTNENTSMEIVTSLMINLFGRLQDVKQTPSGSRHSIGYLPNLHKLQLGTTKKVHPQDKQLRDAGNIGYVKEDYIHHSEP